MMEDIELFDEIEGVFGEYRLEGDELKKVGDIYDGISETGVLIFPENGRMVEHTFKDGCEIGVRDLGAITPDMQL